MPWIAVGLAMLGLLVAFLTHNAGVLFVALATTLLSSLAAVFLFAQTRIDSISRPSVYTPTAEEIAVMRKAAEARKAGVQSAGSRRNTAGAAPLGQTSSEPEV